VKGKGNRVFLGVGGPDIAGPGPPGRREKGFFRSPKPARGGGFVRVRRCIDRIKPENRARTGASGMEFAGGGGRHIKQGQPSFVDVRRGKTNAGTENGCEFWADSSCGGRGAIRRRESGARARGREKGGGRVGRGGRITGGAGGRWGLGVGQSNKGTGKATPGEGEGRAGGKPQLLSPAPGKLVLLPQVRQGGRKKIGADGQSHGAEPGPARGPRTRVRGAGLGPPMPGRDVLNGQMDRSQIIRGGSAGGSPEGRGWDPPGDPQPGGGPPTALYGISNGGIVFGNRNPTGGLGAVKIGKKEDPPLARGLWVVLSYAEGSDRGAGAGRGRGKGKKKFRCPVVFKEERERGKKSPGGPSRFPARVGPQPSFVPVWGTFKFRGDFNSDFRNRVQTRECID